MPDILIAAPVVGAEVMAIFASSPKDDYFNPALLDIDNPQQTRTDLSVYEKGPGQAPGKYQVSVFINNNKIDTRNVTFRLRKDSSGNNSLQPCFTSDELKSLGIKIKKYPG